MSKKTPLGRLKRKLDTEFGKMVMQRDAGLQCVSCGIKPGTQPGHFMRRGLQATRWHPQNVHTQCFRCNCVESGNQLEYAEFLDRRYGSGTSHYLRALSKTSWKPSSEALQALIESAKLGHESYAETWEVYGSDAEVAVPIKHKPIKDCELPF